MFQHPANRRTAYGGSCGCGCGSCGGSYAGTYGAESAKKWEPDAAYIATCADYAKQYNTWLKAYNEYQSLPAFIGIRTGPKVEKAMSKMRKAKAAGNAALAKCQGEEYKTLSETAPSSGVSDEELMMIAGGGASQTGGGASQTGEGTNLLIPIIGVGVLGIGGLVVYRIVQRKKAAKARAAKASAPVARV
jgi:LPXTG-motif cell wall-anchored protein